MKTVFNHVDKAILDMARVVNLFASDKEILEVLETELIGSRGKKINVLTCGHVKLQAVIEDMDVYLGFADVKFEKERLPTISGCSFKINLLTKDHDEISNDLRKRFIITYESRYRTALQRLVSNLREGSMQRPGFWAKLFKRGSVSFKSINPVISEMFTLKEVVPFNGYDSTLKFDILGEIKGIGTYYNNYNPDIYMSVSKVTPDKLTDGVIGNIMSKYIL
ncbi:hypothetical protein PQC65_gp038 [Aeromonas phage pAEv1810]|uniref:hypothetical protein n=1 Tax=Aeromonas phage pAEv1810 TaxID=2908744 RepID=UPI00232967BB|nr:hypothetical protein PQC65_gp038 [Aeromonas phage pAEv1810]UIS24976.1 hypothetical protein pAEv1810_38 [Aeromonas phage pAEv1810]